MADAGRPVKWRILSVAVLVSVPLAITAIYKFVVTPHVARALTECHWAGHAEVAHLTATDPSFYGTQTQLIKACMDERGYAFDDSATSEILAARINAAPAMSLILVAQLEYRLVMEKEHWRMRWFWEQGYVSGTWFRESKKRIPASHAIHAGVGSAYGRY